jgi:hypothetical protein
MTESSWNTPTELVALPSWRKVQREGGDMEGVGVGDTTLDGSEAGLGGVARCTRMMVGRHAGANGLVVPEEQRAMRGEEAGVSSMPGNDFVLTGEHLNLTPDVGIDPATREGLRCALSWAV